MIFRKTSSWPSWGLLFVLFSCSENWPPKITVNETAAKSSSGILDDGLFARIFTNKGEILVRLEYEAAPLTVCNFVALAEGKMDVCAGAPFYDNLSFHRVVPNFMIQGGDPLENGKGGPGYQFPDEFDQALRHDRPGILSMANAGPNTNGSQFFITHKETPWLDDHHTVFGRVIEGQGVVNAIQQGDIITAITILRKGERAQGFKADQAAFDSLLAQARNAEEAKSKTAYAADLALAAAKYPGLSTDANGIQYLIQKPGSGAKSQPGSTVEVDYTGMFLSGEVFDASAVHGGALEFEVGLGQVIPGWDKTILDMRVGEKRLVVIPPELAYGARGVGNVIPPNSFLVFEIELLGIK
ncbi:MAG: peptidylprolyl isomerase [Spirochaetaceae bacterium]|jgi:peptidylprolyl isomerase|nr:peptidylprolyl isomerase [Spirochaetaceae bacterium]